MAAARLSCLCLCLCAAEAVAEGGQAAALAPTSVARELAQLVRRQLVRDNYDYEWSASASGEGAPRPPTAVELRHHETRAPQTTSPPLPVGEGNDGYNTSPDDKWRHHSTENKIELEKNDLLYYVDDKYLRRNDRLPLDDITSTATHRRYDDGRREQTESSRGQRGGHSREGKGSFQQSERHKSNSGRSGGVGGKRKEHVHRRRAEKHDNSNDTCYDSGHNDDRRTVINNRLKYVTHDDGNGEPLVGAPVKRHKGIAHDRGEDDAVRSVDSGDSSRNRSDDRRVDGPDHRPNGLTVRSDEASQGSHDGGNNTRIDIGSSNEHEHSSANYNGEGAKAARAPAAAERALYRLIRVGRARGGRRRAARAQRRLLAGRDSRGEAIIALDPAPFPQFRLPPSRRQYMQQRADRRPPLVEQLPRRSPRPNGRPARADGLNTPYKL